jgi:hypothetical protein
MRVNITGQPTATLRMFATLECRMHQPSSLLDTS